MMAPLLTSGLVSGRTWNSGTAPNTPSNIRGNARTSSPERPSPRTRRQVRMWTDVPRNEFEDCCPDAMLDVLRFHARPREPPRVHLAQPLEHVIAQLVSLVMKSWAERILSR